MHKTSSIMDGVSAIALGIRGPSGKLEFLRRDSFLSNLMRTSDPHSAWTWRSAGELRLWLKRLPEDYRGQLAGRTLLIVPLLVVHGEPQEITFDDIVSPRTDPAVTPPTVEKPKSVAMPRQSLPGQRSLFS